MLRIRTAADGQRLLFPHRRQRHSPHDPVSHGDALVFLSPAVTFLCPAPAAATLRLLLLLRPQRALLGQRQLSTRLLPLVHPRLLFQLPSPSRPAPLLPLLRPRLSTRTLPLVQLRLLLSRFELFSANTATTTSPATTPTTAPLPHPGEGGTGHRGTIHCVASECPDTLDIGIRAILGSGLCVVLAFWGLSSWSRCVIMIH